MKIKSVLYQLFLEPVNNYSAIAISLFLAIAATPVIAQDNTLELQDSDSSDSPTESSEINYRDLPDLKDREAPQSDPAQNITPLPAESADSAESINFATQETDYTLGAGDQIKLDIFQVEEYSGEYPVLVDGTISLPLVGRVDVRGLSLKETSDVVSQEYSTYLKRPIITVGLVAPRPLKIGVSGEVDNPGTYEVPITAENPQFPSVTGIIRQAGGITTIADVRNVRVRRDIKGKEVVYNANLWDLLTQGKVKQDISLRDGDNIFVPTTDEINTAELNRLAEASFGLQTDKPIQVAIVGEVFRPGSHFIQPELLSRNNNNNGTNTQRQESIPPRLTQAINVANGIKPLADVRNVEVRRTTWDSQEKVISVNLWELIQAGDTKQDVILQEGDKIVVPKADALSKEEVDALATASFNRETITVNVVGEVNTPGAQEVQPGTPLNQAILAAGGFNNQRANSSKVELVSLKPDGTVDKRQVEVDLASGIDEETNPPLNHNDVVVVGRDATTAATDRAGQVFSPLGGLFGLLRLIF